MTRSYNLSDCEDQKLEDGERELTFFHTSLYVVSHKIKHPKRIPPIIHVWMDGFLFPCPHFD